MFYFKSDGILTATWTSGDILNYGASVLSLIGTLFLGFIAYLQGENANKMNKRLIEIENRRDMMETYPSLIIDKIDFNDKEFMTNGIFMQTIGNEEGKNSRNHSSFIFSIYNGLSTIVTIEKPRLMLKKSNDVLLSYESTISTYSTKKTPLLPQSANNLILNYSLPDTFQDKDITLQIVFEINNYINEKFIYIGTFYYCWETLQYEIIDFKISLE